MAYYIYKHTSPNGLVYIGKTKQEPKKRWGDGDNYASCPKFFIAIHLYGWDNFTHEIIEETPEDDKILAEREQYWINYYCSNLIGYNTLGYNIFGDVSTPLWAYSSNWKKLGKDAHFDLQETLDEYYPNYSAQEYDEAILIQANNILLKYRSRKKK